MLPLRDAGVFFAGVMLSTGDSALAIRHCVTFFRNTTLSAWDPGALKEGTRGPLPGVGMR